MGLLSVIPTPWRIIILAGLVLALFGGGFVYGARHELNRQKAEAHDELVDQLAASQKRVKEDNAAALIAASRRQAILAAGISSRDKTIALMNGRQAYRDCKLDDDLAAAINEALPK